MFSGYGRAVFVKYNSGKDGQDGFKWIRLFFCCDAKIKMDSYESKAIVTMNHNQKQTLFDNCNGSPVTASWQTHPKKRKYKEGA